MKTVSIKKMPISIPIHSFLSRSLFNKLPRQLVEALNTYIDILSEARERERARVVVCPKRLRLFVRPLFYRGLFAICKFNGTGPMYKAITSNDLDSMVGNLICM